VVSVLTVPVTERKRDPPGEWRDGSTAWYRVSVFGRQADGAGGLHKGSSVFIEGTLVVRDYQDREGHPRVSLDVRGREIRALDRRSAETATADRAPPRIDSTPGNFEGDTDDWTF